MRGGGNWSLSGRMKEAFAYEHRVGFYEADAAGIVVVARVRLWVE